MKSRSFVAPLMLCLAPVPTLLAHDAVPDVTAVAGSTASVADSHAKAVADSNEQTDPPPVHELFKALTFEEDWSALSTPQGVIDSEHMIAPELKYIDLTNGWSASVGGEFRFQYRSEDNKALTGATGGNNDFYLFRERVHGEVRYRDDVRAYVELLNAGISANDAPPSATDRNNVGIENAFVELMSPNAKIRFGRTEMAYGSQRLIGVDNWANTRQTFDGAVASLQNGDLQTDVFVVKPVDVEPRNADEHDGSQYFAGIYNTWRIEQERTFDFYGLLLNENDNILTGGNGVVGNQELYTVGARYAAMHDQLDYELEGARQFGNFADDKVHASMMSAVGGYTVPDMACKPRLALDLDYASGDSSPTDNKHETFNQLFPSSHLYFGFMDLIGRQNIISVMPNVSCQVNDQVGLRLSYADFHLANKHDALYAADGTATLADATGANGNNVGDEIDATVSYRPEQLAPHHAFLFGYSTFKPDREVEGLGNGDRAHMIYAQYTFAF